MLDNTKAYFFRQGDTSILTLLGANDIPDPKRFIGVVLTSEKILYILPKYIGIDEGGKIYDADDVTCQALLKKIKQICKVIHKYSCSENAKKKNWSENEVAKHDYSAPPGYSVIPPEDAPPQELSLNIYDLILSMIMDYNESGLFSAEEEVIEVDGLGDISWERTIDNVIPFVQDNKPYYLDLYTHRTAVDEDNWFRKLHKSVLLDGYNLLRNKGLDLLFDVLPPDLEGEDLSYFGSNEYVHRRITAELGRQFRTHQQSLLKNIDAYITNKAKKMNTREVMHYYGTANSDDLWEKACASVFNDMLYKPLTDCLNRLANDRPPEDFLSENMKALTKNADDAKQTSLYDVIDYPYWVPKGKYAENCQKAFWIGKDIPDIVTLGRDLNGRKFFYILDAKNYSIGNIEQHINTPGTANYIDNPLFKNKVIMDNVPQIEAVRKQIFYYLDFKTFCEKCSIKPNNIKNCFIMPSDSDKKNAELIWTVQLETMQNAIKARDIQVYALPATYIYERYLNNETLSPTEYLL